MKPGRREEETPLQRTIREHEELRGMIQRIRKQAMGAAGGEAGRPEEFPGGAFLGGIDELQSLLAAHFAFEEESGLPEELALRLPHVSEKADRLRQEHVEILRDLMALSEEARRVSSARSREDSQFGEKVLRLLTDIGAHEENETSLIQKAYTDDIGSPG